VIKTQNYLMLQQVVYIVTTAW